MFAPEEPEEPPPPQPVSASGAEAMASSIASAETPTAKRRAVGIMGTTFMGGMCFDVMGHSSHTRIYSAKGYQNNENQEAPGLAVISAWNEVERPNRRVFIGLGR
jgi:hypothetical protein